MPICINCRYPISSLYTTYSKADDKTLGKGVRLTQCPRCKSFADKYVEHDFVVLFIDLVLIRPQVYRHLLFNRLGREDDKLHPSIIRLSLLLLLFDVYLTWARIEKATPGPPFTTPTSPSPLSPSFSSSPAPTNSTTLASEGWLGGSAGVRDTWLATQPILLQYLFFLLLCGIETASFHLPIRWVLGLDVLRPEVEQRADESVEVAVESEELLGSQTLDGGTSPATIPASQSPPPPDSQPGPPGHPSTAQAGPASSSFTACPPPSPHLRRPSLPIRILRFCIPYYPHSAPISTALLISSFTKLFPLLLLVWNYDLPSSASAVSWAVIINNVAALEILLDCGFVRAAGLAGVGAVVRAAVGWGILRMVGVGGGVAAAGVVETGDVIDLWWRLAESMGFG